MARGSRHRHRRLTTLGRALVALGVALLAAAGIALAAVPSADPVGAMVGYMQRAQNLDGGFGGSAGEPSDPGFSAWVAIALAAAGVNPRDQAKPGGRDVHSYLLAHAHRLDATTDFERVALVALAAGTSLRDFGRIDLVARILERQNADGSFPHAASGVAGVNDTIFAVISLSPVPEAGVRDRLQPAADWIEAAQNADGGWAAVMRGGQTDLDMTGAAVQALNAVGRRDTSHQTRAFELFRRAQRADGGFPSVAHDPESNTATTAWVAQAIWSAGQNPRDWNHESGRDPLDYLASMQREDGAIRWKLSRDLNPLWMTAYAAPAYAGRFLPMTAVPPCVCAPPPSEDPPAAEPPPVPAPPGTGDGQGGSDSQGGGAALAGGGGHGAPLFSRPKPQSRGRTPGGARRLDGETRRSLRRSRGARLGASVERTRTTAAQRGSAGDEPAAVQPGRDRTQPEPVPPTPESAAPPPALEPPAPLPGRSEDEADPSDGDGDGPGGDPQVTGTVIGGEADLAAAAGGGDAAAAPGIRGARAGGQPEPAMALGLAGVLLLAAGFGTQVERRRTEETLS